MSLTTTAKGLAPIDTHQALFYSGTDEYLAGIWDFIDPALDRGEPVAIAVPAPKLELLRDELGDRAAAIELLDMFELGRNPARIIPVVLSMIERYGSPLRYVGEPIWAGRSPEEIREATRHEALINLAWPDADVRVLCPYDTAQLDGEVLLDAEHTHPGVVRDRQLAPSSAYADGLPAGCDGPLPGPPPDAVARDFEMHDLRGLRAWVAEQAGASGLDRDRVAGLVTAVNELTTNTIKHAAPHGTLRFWTAPGELVFEVEDEGHIRDPLAGRHRGQATGTGGLGLWMVNHLCDLVEIRTGVAGTTVRAHSRL